MRKFLFSILAFILLLSGCNNKAVESSNKISLADVQSITIKALPSSPKNLIIFNLSFNIFCNIKHYI